MRAALRRHTAENKMEATTVLMVFTDVTYRYWTIDSGQWVGTYMCIYMVVHVHCYMLSSGS